MAVGYTDNPYNMADLIPFVITDKETAAAEILGKQKCYFYDTCSFRRHANLRYDEAEYLLKYIKDQNGIIIITRVILMELASRSGSLNQKYVEYINHINRFGIEILVMYEEDFFSVMEICFSTNETINSYLCWAVRNIKSPVSTITEILEKDSILYDEVIKGKHLNNKNIYRHFFSEVRKNKESGDNLGEELLGICLHILSYLPGEKDGKFCIITDDKGAAGKIDALFKETARQYRGKRIIIFSTPKLVQIMYRESILKNKEHMERILCTGTEGNIVILGTLIFDIRSKEISISSTELADLIIQPNGINIIF